MIWALIEEQGYYESEEDEDEDGLDSDSTLHRQFEGDSTRTMKAKPQVTPTAMVSFGSNAQTMQPISENSDSEGEGDGFFLTSATGENGGDDPSASAPELEQKQQNHHM